MFESPPREPALVAKSPLCVGPLLGYDVGAGLTSPSCRPLLLGLQNLIRDCNEKVRHFFLLNTYYDEHVIFTFYFPSCTYCFLKEPFSPFPFSIDLISLSLSQIKSSGNQVLVVGLGEGLALASEMEQAPLGEAPDKHAKCNWRKMQRQRVQSQPRRHCVLLSRADPLGVLEEALVRACSTLGRRSLGAPSSSSSLAVVPRFTRESRTKLRARRALSRNAVKHEHFDLLVQIFAVSPSLNPASSP